MADLRAQDLADLPDDVLKALLTNASAVELATLKRDWHFWSQDGQRAAAEDWRIWLVRTEGTDRTCRSDDGRGAQRDD
jgi:hypothetical protein